MRSTLDPSTSSKPFILCQSQHLSKFNNQLKNDTSSSVSTGQPPRTQYPEHPPAASIKKSNPHKTTIIPPANYGPVRGSVAVGLQNGTGGTESLNQLGLVPQSVLLVKWEDESMNGNSFHLFERNIAKV